jgi:hypothetical protein
MNGDHAGRELEPQDACPRFAVLRTRRTGTGPSGRDRAGLREPEGIELISEGPSFPSSRTPSKRTVRHEVTFRMTRSDSESSQARVGLARREPEAAIGQKVVTHGEPEEKRGGLEVTVALGS